jgi:predicted DsbA family dithiol-disulfide isomerase
LSQSTRAHRLSVKAYRVGGQDMQQAVLQAYFKVYFHEGKDIGNIDILGDIAQSVGLMSKAEVCGLIEFYVLIMVFDTGSSDHRFLEIR